MPPDINPVSFTVSLKFGEFIIKILLNMPYTFLEFFVVFHHKICVFIIFTSYFDEVSNFHKGILTNQKHELVVSNCLWNCMLMPNNVTELSQSILWLSIKGP